MRAGIFEKHPTRKKWLLLTSGFALLLLVALAYSEHKIQSKLYQGKTVSEWTLQLLSPEPARQEAAAVLLSLGPKAVPELEGLLQKSDSRLRQEVWSHARWIPRPIRTQTLRLVGMPRSTSTRLAAAQALALLGPDAQPAAEALSIAVHDPAKEVQFAALHALAKLGPPEATGFLADTLQNTNADIRLISLNILESHDPPPSLVSEYVRLLQDPNEQVRIAAARAVASTATSARANALHELTPPLRNAIPALLKMAREWSPAARLQAIETLGTIRTTDAATVSMLTSSLRDPSPELREAAAKALYKCASEASSDTAALIQALADPSPRVRQWSALALGRIGPDPAAVHAIKALLHDPEPEVRTTASNVVEKIDRAGGEQPNREK